MVVDVPNVINTTVKLARSGGLWVLVAIAGVLITISFQNYLLFHTLAEFFAIIIAVMMCVVAWQTYSFSRNTFLMYMANGYIWVAMIDLVHTMAYPGMTILPVDGANSAAQLWVVARYMQALVLLSAPLFLIHRISKHFTFIAFGVLATMLVAGVFNGYVPTAFIEGQGLTAFKVYSEYAIIAIMGAALVHLLMRRDHMEREVLYLLVPSIVLTMMAELAFTYYVSAYGLSNLAGHIFKVFAFWLVYLAIVRSALLKPYGLLKGEVKRRRNSETRYATLFEQAADPIFLISPQSAQVVDSNGAAFELLGYEQEDFDSLNIWDVTANEGQKDIEGIIANVLETGLANFESQLCTKDGRTLDVFIKLRSIELEGESLLQAVAHDITAEKQAAEDLRGERDNLKRTLDSMEDGVYIVDRDLHITYANAALEAELGKVNGGACYQQLYGLDERCSWCQRAKDTPGVKGYWEFTAPDTGMIYSMVDASIHNPDGTVHKLNIIRNITHGKALEERLRQAEKMDAIGNLAGGIAHDLKNMLFPIKSLSEMTLKDLDPVSQAYRRMEKVVQATSRATSLVEKIHSFSHTDSAVRKRYAIEDLVRDMIELLEPAVPSSIRLEMEICPHSGIIYADAAQIQTVLMNLASNATDAMDWKPGELKIRVKRTEIEEKDLYRTRVPTPGAYVKLQVSDTGKGIADDVLDHIFDPYFTTKERGKGTGLGLAMVHKIINNHSGAIVPRSKIGTGTTFEVYLPLVEEN